MPKLNLVSDGGTLAGIERYGTAMGRTGFVKLADDLGGKTVATGIDPGQNHFHFSEAENVFSQQPTNAVGVGFAEGTLLPLTNDFSSYLGRPGRYTETGFISFDLTHQYSQEFFESIQNYYDKDLIYTELSEQTDCHVYDAVRVKMENENKIKCHNLTPDLGKNNFNNTFAGYMVHYKGDKKFKKVKK